MLNSEARTTNLKILWICRNENMIFSFQRCVSRPGALFRAVSRSATGEATPTLLDTQRISKIIAHSGMASRRESERWMMDGRVSLNGRVEMNCGTKGNPITDVIAVDGIRVSTATTVQGERPRIWAVFKRSGELVADNDNLKKRPLMMDRIQKLIDPTVSIDSIKPVTRLDFKTEGLVLVTNNSRLARFLNSEEAALKRYFRVRIHGLLTDSKLHAIRRGPFVDGQKYAPMDCKIDRHGKSTISWIALTLSETKSKAINNVLGHLHLKPLRIISTGIGPYSLEKLELSEAMQVMEVKINKELLTAFRNN